MDPCCQHVQLHIIDRYRVYAFRYSRHLTISHTLYPFPLPPTTNSRRRYVAAAANPPRFSQALSALVLFLKT